MISSLADSSFKQYNTYINKWYDFCKQNNTPLYDASIFKVMEFLTDLYNSGNQYGSLNCCRAALSLILGPNISTDYRIQRFFKGVFRLRPTIPKYDITWDTGCVLDYLALLYPNEAISMEKLAKKCVTLLALVTAHRVQTLSKINIYNIKMFPDKIVIKISDLIKTSKVGTNNPVLTLPFFLQKPGICPAKSLISYINRTASIRESDYLFISFKRPHKAVTTQTLSRWIKSTLKDSGVDVSIFSAHSTRHAATSQAYSAGVSIDQIRKTASWSQNSTTFGKFYNRTIMTTNEAELARAILNNNL
ncbi:uncharacterized protein LOC126367357 [Pectinophora gossypiella]|uniref:uncharacterized protein LOC126367357 n=1 Tax=Pectinophora gossypiella TaxID=13191 RepID=UPI00214E880C|nr:uncharacterized protein LOC126367357 [Pectinophora gossypiella]